MRVPGGSGIADAWALSDDASFHQCNTPGNRLVLLHKHFLAVEISLLEARRLAFFSYWRDLIVLLACLVA